MLHWVPHGNKWNTDLTFWLWLLSLSCSTAQLLPITFSEIILYILVIYIAKAIPNQVLCHLDRSNGTAFCWCVWPLKSHQYGLLLAFLFFPAFNTQGRIQAHPGNLPLCLKSLQTCMAWRGSCSNNPIPPDFLPYTPLHLHCSVLLVQWTFIIIFSPMSCLLSRGGSLVEFSVYNFLVFSPFITHPLSPCTVKWTACTIREKLYIPSQVFVLLDNFLSFVKRNVFAALEICFMLYRWLIYVYMVTVLLGELF